jgi:hypothetical protein
LLPIRTFKINSTLKIGEATATVTEISIGQSSTSEAWHTIVKLVIRSASGKIIAETQVDAREIVKEVKKGGILILS